jgi:hypothetical protein
MGDGAFEALRIWVDWDQTDGWEDDEVVVDIADTDDFWVDYQAGGTQFTDSILVPDDAVLGSTWMRARLVWYGDYPVDPGGLAFSGEVEDYSVSISAPEPPPPTPDPIPEPATIVMLSAGLVGIAGYARRKYLHGK